MVSPAKELSAAKNGAPVPKVRGIRAKETENFHTSKRLELTPLADWLKVGIAPAGPLL